MGSGLGAAWLAPDPVLTQLSNDPWGKNLWASKLIQDEYPGYITNPSHNFSSEPGKTSHNTKLYGTGTIIIPTSKTERYYNGLNNVILDTPLKHIQNNTYKEINLF